MADIHLLINKSTELLKTEMPSMGELRKTSIEIDDLINSKEYEELNKEDQEKLQKLLIELKNRIRGSEQAPVPVSTSMPVGSEISFINTKAKTEDIQHNVIAQESMEEAEKLYYSGRYNDAIKLYDQVLVIEPEWERAKQHRAEAETYLRSGHIPAVALPAEAATAFSKAQSAARLGRYQDAMAMLMRAQNILQQLGILRWQEGQEFEQKLQQNIDAENVYNEGLNLFAQGLIDEGIDKIDSAAQVTGLPRYQDRLQVLLKEREAIETSFEALNASILDPKAISQAKTVLDSLLLKYGENPTLLRLKSQMEMAIPRVLQPLIDQIQLLKSQAVRAQTIEAARNRARQARQTIEQAKSIQYDNESINQIQNDVEKILQELTRYEDQLDQARLIVDANRSWPAAAVRMSTELRNRYPNDPGVLELIRSMSPYFNVINTIKILGMVVGGGIILLILWLGYIQASAFFASIAPTLTPTITPTGTNTPTPRPTSTITPTPLPTGTATITPTQINAMVIRDVNVRDGCYEDKTLRGKVPAGSTVRLLPVERRFDTLARECVFIEYIGKKETINGWILIADIK